jgi:hypothetical protein
LAMRLARYWRFFFGHLVVLRPDKSGQKNHTRRPNVVRHRSGGER